MVYHLHKSQQLYCDIETAWHFFSSPSNLSRITPDDMRFNVLSDLPDGSIYEGMIIDYKVSPLLGIPMQWKTLISSVNDHQNFTDVQLKGPYKLWNHFHEFISNEQGVLMKDTVEYALPLSFIGKIAHTLIIRKKLEQIFDFRYEVCEALFNSQNRRG
jgi:ligand-binding SRPBCC domain-containing protein